MIIEDTHEKIKSLDKRTNENFIGRNLIQESEQLIRMVIHTFPKIKVIDQPNFVIHKCNTPRYDFYPPDPSRMDVEISSYAFSAASWKFTDINVLMETLKQFDVIYLYKIECVEITSLFGRTPNIKQPPFIIVSMVVLGWTDILIKGLTDYKF